jgi:hypothetical protein
VKKVIVREALFDKVARFYDYEQKEFTKDIPFYVEYARKFSLIYIAFRSFQCLLTKKDQISCLKCVRDHLVDNGFCILDLFAPRHDYLAQNKMNFDLGEFYDEDNDVYIKRRSEVRYELVNQTLHEDRIYEWQDRSEKLQRMVWSYEIAFLFRYEAELLLEKCGFRVEYLYGSFDRSPYDYYPGEQIFVAKKS